MGNHISNNIQVKFSKLKARTAAMCVSVSVSMCLEVLYVLHGRYSHLVINKR